MARGRKLSSKPDLDLTLYLVPCSCGTTFAVSRNYDRQGTVWGRYLKCPHCGKRHDPKRPAFATRLSARGILEGGWVLAILILSCDVAPTCGVERFQIYAYRRHLTMKPPALPQREYLAALVVRPASTILRLHSPLRKRIGLLRAE